MFVKCCEARSSLIKILKNEVQLLCSAAVVQSMIHTVCSITDDVAALRAINHLSIVLS